MGGKEPLKTCRLLNLRALSAPCFFMNWKKRLAFFIPVCYYNRALKESAFPGVAQLVARLNGVQEAASSNLVTRTKKMESTVGTLHFLHQVPGMNWRPLVFQSMAASSNLVTWTNF